MALVALDVPEMATLTPQQRDVCRAVAAGRNVFITGGAGKSFTLKALHAGLKAAGTAAITVHKCQGMALSAARMDLSASFAPGQVYVGLSRVKSLSGLVLEDFDAAKIVANPDIVQWYERQEAAAVAPAPLCTLPSSPSPPPLPPLPSPPPLPPLPSPPPLPPLPQRETDGRVMQKRQRVLTECFK